MTHFVILAEFQRLTCTGKVQCRAALIVAMINIRFFMIEENPRGEKEKRASLGQPVGKHTEQSFVDCVGQRCSTVCHP